MTASVPKSITPPIDFAYFFAGLADWKKWVEQRLTRTSIATILAEQQRGIAFADALEARRSEVETWMSHLAKQHGVCREEYVFVARCTSWQDFIKAFGPPGIDESQLPDTGSLTARLNRVLDQLALGRQVRTYEPY